MKSLTGPSHKTGVGRFIALSIAAVVVLTACTTASDDDGEADRLSIVATTTIWGDVVSEIVGEDADVHVVMDTGADPHDFQPSSQQVARILRADVVFANGLGLEAGLETVLQSAEAEGVLVIEVAPLLDPLPFSTDPDLTCDPGIAASHDHDDEAHDDHDDEAHDDHDDEAHDDEAAAGVACDPHVWLDPVRVAQATDVVADVLAELAPEVEWAESAAAYAVQLMEAHASTDATLADIVDRNLVTNHDALGYFAARYGFSVVGTVIPGGGTLADPSSSELAELVDLMDELHVTAIFADTTDPNALADAVAAELGESATVVEIYTGSLGPSGSGAESLVGVYLTNASLIAGALG